MLRVFLFLILLLLPAVNCSDVKTVASPDIQLPEPMRLYTSMKLESLIGYEAFEQAYRGYTHVENKKKEIITLIDFTKPSTAERLFVLDMKHRQVLFASHVSHGRNSGDNFATSFSNKEGSYQSSLGFFLTENTYQGKNGYSLVLDGLEKGINDRAKERAIVIHGAPYANPSFIKYGGRLGRSQGCPALPQEVSETIINTIKDGSLVYIYADDEQYVEHSPLLTNRSLI